MNKYHNAPTITERIVFIPQPARRFTKVKGPRGLIPNFRYKTIGAPFMGHCPGVCAFNEVKPWPKGTTKKMRRKIKASLVNPEF